jgi:hypothetical protein
MQFLHVLEVTFDMQAGMLSSLGALFLPAREVRQFR